MPRELSHQSAREDYLVERIVPGLVKVTGRLPATDWRPVGGVLVEIEQASMCPDDANAVARAIDEVVELLGDEGTRRYRDGRDG